MIITAWHGRKSPGCEIHDQVMCGADYKSRCPLSLLVFDTNQGRFRIGRRILLFFQCVRPNTSFISSWLPFSGPVFIPVVITGVCCVCPQDRSSLPRSPPQSEPLCALETIHFPPSGTWAFTLDPLPHVPTPPTAHWALTSWVSPLFLISSPTPF